MIYLVEDDNSIRELVVYTLQSTGFEARGFACGADFWEGMKEDMPEHERGKDGFFYQEAGDHRRH